jgi:hypothetical protein
MDAIVVDNMTVAAIRQSNIHGLGLFAICDIQKGFELCSLDGQLVGMNLIDRTRYNLPCRHIQGHDHCTLLVEWNAVSDKKLLVRPYRTKYSYINHSRHPNLAVIALKVVALTSIAENEELTLDYRKEPLSYAYINGHGATYL